MAITIQDFGADVVEVQDKLAQLLPDIASGQKVIEELRTDNDFNGYVQRSFGDVYGEALTTVDYAKKISDACEKVDEGIASAFEDGKKLLDDDIKEAEQVDAALKTAQETLDTELKQREAKVTSASTDYESNMTSVETMVAGMEQTWDTINGDFTSIRDEITGKIGDASVRHIKHHEDLIKQLMQFEADGFATITQSGTVPLTLFDDTISDMKQAADAIFAEIRKELDEVLDTLQTDRQGMTQAFCDQFRTSAGTIAGPLGELAAAAIANMDECKNNSLGKLQSEVSAAQQSSDKAKSLVDDVSTKVDDVQEVKRNADEMNQAM